MPRKKTITLKGLKELYQKPDPKKVRMIHKKLGPKELKGGHQKAQSETKLNLQPIKPIKELGDLPTAKELREFRKTQDTMVGLQVIILSEYGEYVGVLGQRYMGGMYLKNVKKVIKKPDKNDDIYYRAINGFLGCKLSGQVKEIYIKDIKLILSCSKKSIKTLS